MSDMTVNVGTGDDTVGVSWFDALPPAVRHVLLVLIASGLAAGLPWVALNYTTWNLPPQALWVIGALLPVVIAWVTPLTSQYNLFKPKPAVASAGSAGEAVYPDGDTPVMVQDDEATDLTVTPVPERELDDPADGVDR